MVTRETIEEALKNLPTSSDAYKVLYLINLQPTRDPDGEATYDAETGTLTLHGEVQELDEALRNPFTTTGRLFVNGKGKPFVSNRTFMIHVNEVLKGALNTTIRTVRAVLRPPEMVGYQGTKLGDSSEWTRLDSVMVDEDVREILDGVDVYVQDTGYPFIPIYHPNEIMLRYDLFRYVGGLPHWTALSQEWRLPTIDHIHHDKMDTRRKNLRYCTTKQNGKNICGSSSLYHGVNRQNECTLPRPLSEADAIRNLYVRTWGSLITPAMMDGYEGYSRSYLWEGACKGSLLSTIPESHLSFLDAFIGELLSTMDDLVEEEYTREVLERRAEGRETLMAILRDTKELRLRSVIRPTYIGAVCYDIVKIHGRGEWAHTNFMRIPEPRYTLEDTRHDMDPVEVLNMYEEHRDVEFVNEEYERLGFGPEAQGQRRLFEWGEREGRRVITARFVERTGEKAMTLKVMEEEYITNPRTIYKQEYLRK